MNVIKWIKSKIYHHRMILYHHRMIYKRKKEQLAWNKKIKESTINFPYIVEFEGDWSFRGYMDIIGEWCINNIGNCCGECDWYSCNDSFDRWYDNNNLDDDLNKMLEKSNEYQTRLR